jgi:hypothetical protein
MDAMKPGVAALCLLLLCACAEAPRVDWQRREARWIVAPYAPGRAAELPACLARLSDAELARRHFVELRYRHVRVMRTAVAGAARYRRQARGAGGAVAGRLRAGHLSRISKLLPADSN